MLGPTGEAPLLLLEGFGVTFGNRLILTDIDLQLEAGGVDVLMGPVKAGKSTLLRALAGLHDNNPNFHTWGRAWLAGEPLHLRRPALVQQHVAIMQATVRDALVHQLRTQDLRTGTSWNEHAAETLASHGLGTLAQQLNQPLIEQTRAHQRAITILSHALSQPALLMIDEPTYGLTDDEAGWLVQWLKSLGSRQRLLVTLHHQKQARALADRIILLGGGRILAHQDTYRFFTNSGNAWVEQFLRSGSLPIASPDAQPEHLDPGVPPPPPLSDPARQALAAAQTPAAAPAPPAPSAPPAATAAPAVRPRATLPPLSPQGVSTAALVGTAAPPDSRGPNGFHWIVPGKLAGTAEPGLSHSIDYDLDLLARIGVTHLISLTEKDLDQEALGRHGLQNIHLPVFDRETPSIAQTYMLLRRMQKLLDEGKVVAVHCKAGIGRTGTVLAAWMIREGGLSTSSAIERLRLINKSYVQTEMQENFLHAFEADMLMRL